MTTPTGYMTAPEAAAEIGVASVTVTKWARLGLITGARVESGLPGGPRWLIPRRWLPRGVKLLEQANKRRDEGRALGRVNRDTARLRRDDLGRFTKGEA